MRKFITCCLAFGLAIIAKPAMAQLDSTKFTIIEDTSVISTMEDVLQLPYFKDKVVYVDVWGTRCAPCLEEFGHMPALKAKYKDKPVVFLYLKSPYGFDDSKEWKEMMYRYKLDGIHIAMSQQFYSNNFWQRYKDKYTEERSYGIPTYLIVGKNGVIIDYDAPRPSKTSQLHQKIDAAL